MLIPNEGKVANFGYPFVRIHRVAHAHRAEGLVAVELSYSNSFS
jgi:hypothetical protein